MNMEKAFWIIFGLWFLIRATLLCCQYVGNTDSLILAETLKYFSQEDINASRSYSLSGFWFKAIYGTIYMSLLVVMLRFGYFNKIWLKISGIVGEGLFRRELLFIIIFLLILQVFSLPSSFYFGYYNESISGFSNIDITAWFLRYFKSAGISLAFNSAIFLALIAVLRYLPKQWPWVLPLVLGSIAAVSMLLMSIIITPLFYNQKPLEAGEFRNKLLDMAAKANLTVNEIYVIDESRYSKHTNAYFSGFGKYRRIVLYDNLINSHTPEEAALIFAHEAGHWKYNHILWGLSCGILGAFAACYLVYFLSGSLAKVSWFGVTNLGSASVIPFFMIAYMMLQIVFAPIESQISQIMERQADRTSIELTGLKETFIKAQIRLAKDNKSDLLPHPFRVFWLYSHPTALERIKSASNK